jgi:hypothetical protein
MTSRLFLGLYAVCSLLIAGCAPMELAPDELVIKPQVRVEHQTGKSLVVPLPKVRKEFRSTWTEIPMQELEPELFHDVLVTTLGEAGLFRQVAVSGDADYSLRSEVIVQRLTGIGLMLLFVRYELVDITTGQPVWQENLLTYKNLTAADVFTGWDRVRQLTQITVQAHMGDLIEKLNEVMQQEGRKKPDKSGTVRAPASEPTIAVTPKVRNKAESPVKEELAQGEHYPRKLTGNEIRVHFQRHKRFTFDKAPRVDFTMEKSRKGHWERICSECTITTGIGTMHIKVPQGLVCFDWDQIS